MPRYVTSITTPMSQADAFAYMSDLTHYRDWDPSIKRAVRVPQPETGVGAAYELTFGGAAPLILRYVVKELEAPRRMVIAARTPLLTSVDEVRVDEAATGSTVTYDANLRLRGPLRLLEPFVGFAFRRISERAAAGLRRVLSGTEVAH